jgi:type I restriction enzyme S subunit
LSYPPLETQIAIGEILGVLDDKIDISRRMNETLEAIARAIFKNWFVDFGPTRAKMESRPPYLAPEIWALFPKQIDNEEKPLGWRNEPLDQIAEFLNGLPLQKYAVIGEHSLPVIKIAQLRAGNVANSDRASADIPAPYIIENGDLLFSWSGSLLHRIWTAGRGALNQHLFKVTSKRFPKWFYFHWIEHHMEHFRATAASKATTMGHIQRHHLSEAMTIVPSDPLMTAANKLIEPIFNRTIANDLETSTLAATRDLLLPKLMSGEIRVKDAEKIAEAAL